MKWHIGAFAECHAVHVYHETQRRDLVVEFMEVLKLSPSPALLCISENPGIYHPHLLTVLRYQIAGSLGNGQDIHVLIVTDRLQRFVAYEMVH